MSEFETLNLQEMADEGARLAGNNNANNNDYLKNYVRMPIPKPGKLEVLAVRILPPLKGMKLFQATRLHKINGRRYHCPKNLVGGKWDKTPCPICDQAAAIFRRADKAEDAGASEEEVKEIKAKAREIYANERYYYNVIVRKMVEDGKELVNVGPRILSVGKLMHKTIVRAILGDETEKPLGDVTNLANGWDLLIKVELRGTGKDAYPNFERSCFDRDPSPAGTQEEITAWAQKYHDLTALRNVKPYDVLEKELAIYRGLIPDTVQQQFDEDAFDAKYRNAAGGGDTSAASSVPTAAVYDADGAPVSQSEGEPMLTPAEEIQVSDEEFYKEFNQDLQNS